MPTEHLDRYELDEVSLQVEIFAVRFLSEDNLILTFFVASSLSLTARHKMTNQYSNTPKNTICVSTCVSCIYYFLIFCWKWKPTSNYQKTFEQAQRMLLQHVTQNYGNGCPPAFILGCLQDKNCRCKIGFSQRQRSLPNYRYCPPASYADAWIHRTSAIAKLLCVQSGSATRYSATQTCDCTRLLCFDFE